MLDALQKSFETRISQICFGNDSDTVINCIRCSMMKNGERIPSDCDWKLDSEVEITADREIDDVDEFSSLISNLYSIWTLILRIFFNEIIS